jgi:hypothetical protein
MRSSLGGQRRGAESHVGRDGTVDDEAGAEVPADGVRMSNDL